MFNRKPKEINSDLFYKMSLEDKSEFSYTKNSGKKKENQKSVNLKPGDWIDLDKKNNFIFEERKFLNFLYTFIIKRRSLFALLVQFTLLVCYFMAYALMIYQFDKDNAFNNVFANAVFTIIIKDLLLLLPLIVIFWKMCITIYRSFTIIGPAKSLKSRFKEINSIKFCDVKNKYRTIKFDLNGKMLEDKKGEYYFRESEKVSSQVYKFDLLIVNKNAKDLFKLEYYTVQLDFKQDEGVLMTKDKKLEYSKLEIIR